MRMLFLSVIVYFSSTLHAQVTDTILTLPEGQIILNITATERREVDQDLLVARLSYRHVDSNPRELQSEINSVMQSALDLIKQEAVLKVRTDSYQVYEIRDSLTKERKWEGSQALTIKSKNSEVLLDIVGKLQGLKLSMDNLSYTVAPETAIEIQDNLMEAALQQLQVRANRAAKALGKTKAELRDVNVDSDSIGYHTKSYSRSGVYAEDMSMALAGSAAPVAAAGEDILSLTVTARALLK